MTGPGIRAALVALVVGGTLLVLVPGVLVRSTGGFWPEPGPVAALGALLVLAGLVAVSWTIRDFAVTGRGTPNPLDPPRVLVTRGLYRRVRNPMALGFVTVLLGEAAVFGSIAMVVYALASLGAIHLLVVFHEEPANRRRFGAAFDAYCAKVPRWIPRLGALVRRSRRGRADP